MCTPASTRQPVQEHVPTEPAMLHRMRWFFLILITLWIFGAMVLPIVAFCLTTSVLCFTFYTALVPPVYILSRIAGYLFPKDEKDFQLAFTKIWFLAQKEAQKTQVR